MLYMPNGSLEWGDDGFVIVAMGDGFSFLAILLVGELKMDLGAGFEFVGGNSSGIVGAVIQLEQNVHQSKGMVVVLAVDMLAGA